MARWQWERRQRVRGAPEGPSCTTRVDDIYILSITLRALNYENYGRFPIMGHAGFISSTVSLSLSLSLFLSFSLCCPFRFGTTYGFASFSYSITPGDEDRNRTPYILVLRAAKTLASREPGIGEHVRLYPSY